MVERKSAIDCNLTILSNVTINNDIIIDCNLTILSKVTINNDIIII